MRFHEDSPLGPTHIEMRAIVIKLKYRRRFQEDSVLDSAHIGVRRRPLMKGARPRDRSQPLCLKKMTFVISSTRNRPHRFVKNIFLNMSIILYRRFVMSRLSLYPHTGSRPLEYVSGRISTKQLHGTR